MDPTQQAQLGAAAVAAFGVTAVLCCRAPAPAPAPPAPAPAPPQLQAAAAADGEVAPTSTAERSLLLPTETLAQLGDMLLSSEGAFTPRTLVPTTNALAGKKLVAVFFSARWSAPCLDFTPRLVEWYSTAAAELGVEVVYVSCDVDEEGFTKHFDEMPWLAVPFADRQRASRLRAALGVNSTPSVVLLDGGGTALGEEATLRALPGLPEVEVLAEDDASSSGQRLRGGLARLREGGLQEYRLDGTTRAGKQVAGWHSRERPDKASRALRCYLDGAVVRASKQGSWLKLEKGHGFLRKDHWGAGWRSTEPEPAPEPLGSFAEVVQSAQQVAAEPEPEPDPDQEETEAEQPALALCSPPVFTPS